MTNPVYRFLQVDRLVCDNCGKPLDGVKGYLKLDLYRQFFFFTWGWFKAFFGDHRVSRFCDEACHAEWQTSVRLQKETAR
jgi:hypothetical protein